jgi:hypothetical protein
VLFRSAKRKLRQRKATVHECREEKRGRDEIQLLLNHKNGELKHLNAEQKPAERQFSTEIASISTKACSKQFSRVWLF